VTEYQYQYRKRKALGICTHCGRNDAEPGRVECKKCLAKHKLQEQKRRDSDREAFRKHARERMRQRKAEARANGLCSRCCKEPADKGYKTCWRCRANNRGTIRHRVMSDEQKQRNAELAKARKEERIEKHICVRCGKRPAQEGGKECRICRAKINTKRREKAHERGVIPREMGGDGLYCRRCFKPKCHGERICPDCADKLREQGRQLYDWNKAHGWKCSRRFREKNNYHFTVRSSWKEVRTRIDYNAVRYGRIGG